MEKEKKNENVKYYKLFDMLNRKGLKKKDLLSVLSPATITKLSHGRLPDPRAVPHRRHRPRAGRDASAYVKRHHPHLPELLQRLVNRGTALVQPEPCTVLTHCFPPSLVLCTKP